MIVRCAAMIVASLLSCGAARAQRAEGVTLRFASVAPQGTAWARELRAWARDVETDTGGAVRIKWYLGGIAGDEAGMLDRMKRHQLDGVASGGPICEWAAPSLKVTRVVGLMHDHLETSAILNRLHQTFEKEASARGYALLSTSPIGAQILFTRHPVTSIEALRTTRLWAWEFDDVLRMTLPAFGVKTQAGSLQDATLLYDDGKVDGLITPASVALAFQWSTKTRYFLELPLAMLNACVLVTRPAFDSLPIDVQRAMRSATAKLAVRFNDLSRRTDEQLLGGLFQKQGLKRVDVDDRFRAMFYDLAKRARENLDPRIVPPELLIRVQSLLADYRAENRAR